MLLRTFGGLTIEPDRGERPLPSLGPRRLALLAVVAAAGARGITRDTVIGILWPDKPEELARHTLSQTLYLLRRETGCVCIEGTTVLRLDRALRSDVAQFHDALATGDPARAAALYTGPFLDGFYLTGAPEFEHWVDDTRTRLHFAALRSIETQAKRAVEADAVTEALSWWRRLVELDPLNVRYVTGHVQTLAALGDSASALRAAHEYESRMRRELETEPDPIIIALIEQLRALTPKAEPTQAARVAASDLDVAGLETPDTRSAASPQNDGAAPRRGWLAAAVVALVLGAVGWQLRAVLQPRNEAPRLLAVGAIQSRDSTLPALLLRDMLATSLGSVTGIRVVANSRLLELLPGDDTSAAAMTDAARRAGAHEIIEGDLVANAGGLVLMMRRVVIRTGEVLQGYTVRAPDVFALTDSAWSAIAYDLGVDAAPAAAGTAGTRSSVAYTLYEHGLRAFHAANYASAVQLMHAALGRDSTFAMAAAYAWRATLAMSGVEAARRELPTVQQLTSRAPERERLLVEAFIATYFEAPLDETLTRARRLVEKYPDDVDGYLLLGRALFNAGDWQRAIASFDRVAAIDSAAGLSDGANCRICESITGARDAYLWFDSAAAAERAARRLIALSPTRAAGLHIMTEPLLRQGRRAEAEAANADAARLGGGAWVNYHSLNRDLIRTGRLDELEARLIAEVETAPRDMVGELPWLLAILLRNQGRLREARQLAADGTVPGTSRRLSGHHDLVTLAIAAFEAAEPRESARRFLDMLAGDRAQYEAGHLARNLSWHMTLTATALAAAGDTASVRAWADSIRRIAPQSSIGRDVRLPHFLDGLLLQRQNRHADAVDAFRRAVFSTTDGYTRINLEMARSLVALQRYPEAVAILQPALRGGVDGSNSYVTHTELHEALAHAFHAAGQRDSARVHYAAVERAWRRADPQFAGRFATATARAH